MASPSDYDVVHAFTGDLDKVSWSYWHASAVLWHCAHRSGSPVARRVKNPDVKDAKFGLSVYYGPRTSAGPKNTAVLLLMHKSLFGQLRPEDIKSILGITDPSPLERRTTAKGAIEIDILLHDLMADTFCLDNGFEPGPTPPEVSQWSLFEPPPELHPSKWDSLDLGDESEETSDDVGLRVSSNLQELGHAKYPEWFIAYEALERIGSPAVASLLQAIENENGLLRGRALDLLGRIGDEQAIVSLEKAASMSEDEFRRIANIPGSSQVTQMGDMRIEVPLSDLWEEHRENARKALDGIRGRLS